MSRQNDISKRLTIFDKRSIFKERLVVAQAKSKREIKKIRNREDITATIFMAIPLIIVTMFVFLSFFIAMWLTFYAGYLTPSLKSLKYVGLKNWNVLFQNTKLISWFKIAVRNTVIFAFVTMAFNIVGALIISSILNSKKIKRKNIFMTFYFFPQLTSSIASALIFLKLGKSVFNFNYIINPNHVLYTMIISTIWGGISGGMVTFNTAFSGVDNTQYEAADIDGANSITRFFKITIPSLGPILAYTIITSIIGGMGVFDQAFAFAANNASEEGTLTWALFGFALIKNVKGLSINAEQVKSVGIGMAVLFLLGATIFTTSRIANIFRPIDNKGGI